MCQNSNFTLIFKFAMKNERKKLSNIGKFSNRELNLCFIGDKENLVDISKYLAEGNISLLEL